MEFITIDRESCSYIIKHVFLPAKLPQSADDSFSNDAALQICLCDTLHRFLPLLPITDREPWSRCLEMMTAMRYSRDDDGKANLISKNLTRSIVDLKIQATFALHVRSQNAALLIKRLSEGYSFAAFELSPRNDAVLGGPGRLRRCFPGPAVIVSTSIVQDESFLKALVDALIDYDERTMPEACPKTRKAGSKSIETRDTVHPGFVTDMLIEVLGTLGKAYDPARIWKNTREEVLWKDAELPWRRSPLWLLLRVALQTSCDQILTEPDQPGYKAFMIFLLSQILRRGIELTVANETLHIMVAKICRRILKLSPIRKHAWLVQVETQIASARLLMQRRWSAIEGNPDPNTLRHLWVSTKWDASADTKLRLHNLGPYLDAITSRPPLQENKQAPLPTCSQRISLDDTYLPDVNTLKSSSKDDVRMHLTDFETWIETNLDKWLVSQISNEECCRSLADLYDTYIEHAVKTYANEPERYSVMILTVMEIWMSMDKCTRRHHPIVSEYDTGIDVPVFEALLLSRKAQMKRLRTIEAYLYERRTKSDSSLTPIFATLHSATCLSARYFDQSTDLQNLKAVIEKCAKRDRKEKLEELDQSQKRYKELINDASMLSCEYHTTTNKRGRTSTHHSHKCRKHGLLKRAEAMQITVHEWPLPSNDIAAKATIFELQTPDCIFHWRRILCRITHDLLSDQSASAQRGRISQHYSLNDYAGLRKWRKITTSMIQATSVTKPFSVSHYRSVAISNSHEKGVCVNCGLTFELYDATANIYTKDADLSYDIRPRCTFQLISPRYQSLKDTMRETKYSSNVVIAKQNECAPELSLHEFYAFGTLRSGHRLQWRNVARELMTGTLNFSQFDVTQLILQTIYQAGPIDGHDLYRGSHVDLTESCHCFTILNAVSECLKTVQGNWKGVSGLRMLISIARRVLSMAPDAFVENRSIEILEKLRAVAFDWQGDLTDRIGQETSDHGRALLTSHLLEVALVAQTSFDVDATHLYAVIATETHLSEIVESCIIIQSSCHVNLSELSKKIRHLLFTHRRFLQDKERYLLKLVHKFPEGVNRGISRRWPALPADLVWRVMEEPQDRWIEGHSNLGGARPADVQYNILDGTLLVKGSPVSRLPKAYEQHESFRRVLGSKVLDVVPSASSVMSFESRNDYYGHKLSFRLYQDELIIRSEKAGQIYELLPVKLLQDDFPISLSRTYTHWLDVQSGSVDFRPLADSWTISNHTWSLQIWATGRYLCNMKRRLIDFQSQTAEAIIARLEPLETSAFIELDVTSDTGEIHARLPRYKLDFRISQGSSAMISTQFRGMQIDDNQTIGTLTGLRNKLVICNQAKSQKSVIIPYGRVQYAEQNEHVAVTIDREGESISYHHYRVDETLGQLRDDVTLRGKLYQCYLHAVTSHCLTDNLTSHTGVEEALIILRSAAMKSYPQILPDELALLEMIAELTPHRVFYPAHLKNMQSVQWRDLPSLSQHESFRGLVQTIIAHANKIGELNWSPQSYRLNVKQSDAMLNDRAMSRHSSFYVNDFGAEQFSIAKDAPYVGRVEERAAQTSISRVHKIASLVHSWTGRADLPHLDLLSRIESWSAPISWLNHRKIDLRLDQSWLEPVPKILPRLWCGIHRGLAGCSPAKDKYWIMIFLSHQAYGRNADMEIIQILWALALIPKTHLYDPAEVKSLTLSEGYGPSKFVIRSIIDKDEHIKGMPMDWNSTIHSSYDTAITSCVDRYTEELYQQWPRRRLETEKAIDLEEYICIGEAKAAVQAKYDVWHANNDFRAYVIRLQSAIAGLRVANVACINENAYPRELSQPLNLYEWKTPYIALSTYFESVAPSFKHPPESSMIHEVHISECSKTPDTARLHLFLGKLGRYAKKEHEHKYVHELEASARAMHTVSVMHQLRWSDEIEEAIQRYEEACSAHHEDCYRKLHAGLMDSLHISHQMVIKAGLGPRISPRSILGLLRDKDFRILTRPWQEAIIRFAISIRQLQWVQRLRASPLTALDLSKELLNINESAWDPYDLPGWLLFEIESNMLIRPVQARIAKQLISPEIDSNSVTQLNMGEGKTSVIVPIAIWALADGKQAVRVIVLKPLAGQMHRGLIQKVSGLLNMQLYFMPVSRTLRVGANIAQSILQLYQECMEKKGVLLLQPEHVSSLELMIVEHVLRGERTLSNQMIELSNWLTANTRDILDESDEILSVRFELVYTWGTQRPVDLAPERWTLIQNLLSQLVEQIGLIATQRPSEVELEQGPSGIFPLLRIFDIAAGKDLQDRLARAVCSQGLPSFPTWRLSDSLREALFRFFTDRDSDFDIIETVASAMNGLSVRKTMLYLRGILGQGILSYCLQRKRWRVNFGLDSVRTMMAVPYHAKDTPSVRSEFSHPDVASLLTCLSYYYGGLSDHQLRLAFERLLTCDFAEEEYQRWVRDSHGLDTSFKRLANINIEDELVCNERIFPCLRRAKSTVDFYLSDVVFAKHMREFPHKLSTSGWDLARTKAHLVTGFSGTNDSRNLLPLSIHQEDLPLQLGTNASVLNTLLRPENVYQCLEPEKGHSVSIATRILNLVAQSEPSIKVVLDVGAQVLECDNREFSRRWLTQTPAHVAQVCVFFDKSNVLSILDRAGATEPFETSPYFERTDHCIVFLDESHTRGTDLRLPSDYRALVTLGPGLVKDRLVQACMRMRRLGRGQSVLLAAAPEIDRKIRAHNRTPAGLPIKMEDVLAWCIQETCDYLRHCVPLWASQGIRFQEREATLKQLSSVNDVEERATKAKALLEKEGQSIEDRYGPRLEQDYGLPIISEMSALGGTNGQAQAFVKIRDKCLEYSVRNIESAAMSEEQERELFPESEREQVTERPAPAEPAQSVLHPDLHELARNGVLDMHSTAIVPITSLIHSTTLEVMASNDLWPETLLATADFGRTIRTTKDQNAEDYINPVRWILSPRKPTTPFLLIVSPHEANDLMPSINAFQNVILHCYNPRIAMSQPSLSKLQFFSLPIEEASRNGYDELILALNMFAGQTYFDSYGQYQASRGLFEATPDLDEAEVAGSRASKLEFLKGLINIRRKGQSFGHSHIGKICNGERLAESAFDVITT